MAVALIVIGTISGCGPAATPERVETSPTTGQPAGTTPAPAATPTVFAIGETVRIGNFQITVNKTRKQTSGDNPFLQPAAGHVWYIVECTVENIHTSASQMVSSVLQFALVDQDGRSQEMAIGANTKGQLDGELGVGRKMTGELAWEVPIGTKGLELIFTPSPFQLGQAVFRLGDL